MKRVLLLIIGLIIEYSLFSQTDIKIKILPSKIATQTEMVIPIGDKYIFEKYMYFKYVYFLQSQDTLVFERDSILKGSNVIVDLKNNYKSIDYCDSKINFIRNSSLLHRNYSMIDDTIRKYIGYDNKEFETFRENDTISEIIQKTTCFDDFKLLASSRFKKQVEKINEINLAKFDRIHLIRNHPDSINLDFIRNYLKDFNYCVNDQMSFIELIIAKPNDLFKCCDELEDFFLTKLRLDNLPKNQRLLIAKSVLDKGDFKGKIYRQIKRKINKNVG